MYVYAPQPEIILRTSKGIVRQKYIATVNKSTYLLKDTSHRNDNHLTSTHRTVHKFSLAVSLPTFRDTLNEVRLMNGLSTFCEIFQQTFAVNFARFINILTEITSGFVIKSTNVEHFCLDGK